MEYKNEIYKYLACIMFLLLLLISLFLPQGAKALENEAAFQRIFYSSHA
ncbi:MAG: hypothetical protein N3I35_05355 [Clostridia bacterium]|nr:hypothetical protein [Clostridia bacterium]